MHKLNSLKTAWFSHLTKGKYCLLTTAYIDTGDA